ncbi:threonine aldolase family protein [Achromobacter pestifer]|uniref:L-threonine aldolase n=1 Tax=Achromobacter pestifer TaxID=1353889 RepID=A0A6S6Z469_9BURK|nr:low specificity L-threonine aldolase [Achromobacter pestifer]CAB3658895.1 Low specificity L-threonine aldolase [Achromobacter pestifer]
MTTPLSVPALQQGFSSDNIAGASPEVFEALMRAGAGQAPAYGADDGSLRVQRKLADIFEHDVDVLLVPTGTAANSISLAALTPPWGAVLCHTQAHIANDECGAPEFYTHGARLKLLGGDAAKIDPVELAVEARRKVGDVHSVQPSCVSITQATETGAVYTLDEINVIGGICRDAGLPLHMDGARFANALVSLDCTPAEMTWKAGVEILSFGATKNGVLGAEAIVLFNPARARELEFRRKRGGHLFSKMRLLSAQLEAYLDNNLWLRNARQANAMAARLAAGMQGLPGVTLQGTVDANILFCQLPAQAIEGLLADGFRFYHDRWGPGVVRLVTSFATQEQDVDHFLAALRARVS